MNAPTAIFIAVIERHDQPPVADFESTPGRMALYKNTLATVKQRLAELSAYHEADLRAVGADGPDGVLGSMMQLQALCGAVLVAGAPATVVACS